MNIEKVILSSLIFKEDYFKKVFPFLKEEYFDYKSDKVIFNIIKNYVDKYNSIPKIKTVGLELISIENLSEEVFNECKEVISGFKNEDLEISWLYDKTEEFCKEKSLYNAIRESILIIEEGNKSKHPKTAIPQMVTDALSISFNTDIGHDYFDDAEKRWDYFNQPQFKIPFSLEYFNKITKGGLSKKTLTIIIAGTGVGKSFLMCQFAADNLMQGKNVLYITLEMASELISQRIDANLIDMRIDEVEKLEKEKFLKMVDRVKMKTTGKLIVHEYPTSSASTLHFKTLLNELKLKKGFVPDIVYIDYLGICASSRVKLSNQINSYALIKAVAEELRAFAKEFDVPVVSAVQFNREGFASSDPTLSNTSESFGVPFTADLMFGLVTSEELEELGQLMVKQLKNRYNDVNRPKRFVIGIDRAKMKCFDLDEKAQKQIMDRGKNVGTEPEEEEMESFVEEKKEQPKKSKANLFEDFI